MQKKEQMKESNVDLVVDFVGVLHFPQAAFVAKLELQVRSVKG
jgi:hypothetical protein